MHPEQASNPEPGEDDARHGMLVVLEVSDYLTEEQAGQAHQRLKDKPDEIPASDDLRHLLDWLIAEGYTTAEAEAKATRNLMETRFDNIHARLALLQLLKDLDPPQFERRLDELVELAEREQKRKQTFIGLAGLAAALAIGAYLLWPASTPTCSASETVKTLNLIMFDVRMDMIRKNTMATRDLDSETYPRISNHREIGYDESNRSRGCVADMSIADLHTNIGYVVRPNEKGKGDFVVQMFPPEYVIARYNEQGLNSRLGAPVGREAISTAFMAGVVGFDSKVSRISPSYGKPLLGDDTPTTMERSVLGVVPAEDCKQIDSDHVSCPLLIDYRDRLLGAFGAPSMLQLKGDFTFVKDGSGWKMADDFTETLTKALVERRIAKVYGEERTDKMNAQK
ncbi:hypothetical protein [Burkholderia stagnalis]|uniref:hypothetical protein n=1 Tax=Burkholderia stagnalis TaxID=1503054 RepID=UPI000A575E2E|nr:hypothetical protein [Burkholderia stagnalis]